LQLYLVHLEYYEALEYSSLHGEQLLMILLGSVQLALVDSNYKRNKV